MEPVKSLNVTFENHKVGTMALTADRLAAFQSDFYKPVTEMIREYADEDLADIMILE